MSSTVLVCALSLLPFPFLSPSASLYLSIAVVIGRKPGSGRKEERQRKEKEEEEDEEVEQLYTNQDFPEYLHGILPFTTAGTLYCLGIFGVTVHAVTLAEIQRRGSCRTRYMTAVINRCLCSCPIYTFDLEFMWNLRGNGIF